MIQGKQTRLESLMMNQLVSLELDNLNHLFYAEVLEKILRNAESPINIGLFGLWGIGKSSILNLLEKRITKDPTLRYIYIDAWDLQSSYVIQEFLLIINNKFQVYTNEKDLLDEIFFTRVDPIEIPLKKRIGKYKLSMLLSGILSVIIGMNYLSSGSSIGATEISPFVGGLPIIANLLAIGAIVSAIIPQYGQIISKIESDSKSVSTRMIPRSELSYQFHRIFKYMLEKILHNTNENSLVIAIDNLDRCDEKTTIEILNLIKTFMNLKGCKFIISCNDQIILNYIKDSITVRRNEKQNQQNEREFLNKFFQAALHVSKSPDYDLFNYCDRLIKNSELPFDPTISEIFILGKNITPRKIKRYFNDPLSFIYNGNIKREIRINTKGISFWQCQVSCENHSI